MEKFMSIQFKRRKKTSTNSIDSIKLLSGQPLIDLKTNTLYVGSTETTNEDIAKVSINATKTNLYTSTSIGKFKVQHEGISELFAPAGTTYDDIFAKIFDITSVATEPTPIQPSISSFSLSFPTNTDDEVGTNITSLKYNVSLNKGSYKLGTTYLDSGVTFSKVEFLYNGSVISSATVNNPSTSFSGTLPINLILTNTSQTVTITCRATHSKGSIPKNSENTPRPNLAIAANTIPKDASVSKTGIYYPYYLSSPSLITSGVSVSTSSYSGLTRGSLNLVANSVDDEGQANIAVAAKDNFYIFNKDNGNKVIQKFNDITKWSSVETAVGTVELTTKQGNTVSYYMYREVGSYKGSDVNQARLIDKNLVS